MINMFSEYILLRAMAAAENVFDQRYKHGCVIFDKHNNILSTGYNKKINRPSLYRYGYRKCFLHAESDAILKVDKNKLNGMSLLVVRLNKRSLGNSKPCKSCMALIVESNIKNIFYSDVNGNIQHMEV